MYQAQVHLHGSRSVFNIVNGVTQAGTKRWAVEREVGEDVPERLVNF